MSSKRELNEAELDALELNARAGLSRSALETGSVKSDTMEGKLIEEWRAKGLRMMEERKIKLTEATLKVLDEWVAEQVKSSTKRRQTIRQRNVDLIKQFGKGGRFEGRRLDPRAFFKGDELEDVALEPGGISDAMAMKSSLPTAIAYLAHLQKEGHDTFTGIDYSTIIY